MLKKLFWLILSLLWAAMILILFTGVLDSGRSNLLSPEELLGEVHLEPETTWMGIYIQGSKIGYVHSELEPLADGGYEMREFSCITGAMMGTKQVMKLRMNVITDSTLALVEFNGRIDSAPYTTSYKGNVREKVLSVQISTAGKTVDRFFPAPEPIYLSQVIKPLIQSGELDKGDSLKLVGFDPIAMEMQDLFVVSEGGDKRKYRGREHANIRKLKTYMAGFESTILVDSNGNTLAEYGPMGMELHREEMEQALALEEGSGEVDFLSIYAVKPKGEIKTPRKINRARYRLTNVSLEKIGSVSGRQKVIDEETGLIEVTQEHGKVAITAEELSVYTRDAPYIESRDLQIRTAAAQAMQDGTSRLDSLHQLNEWVFHTIEKQPSAGIPSALAVLKTRKGDCNEHAILFTAMARSVGIPARLQLGVVYQAGLFYYHAWVAAWAEDRWMEFEPTFGLEIADAARIALAAGDLSNAVELAGIIGQLEIEILIAE